MAMIRLRAAAGSEVDTRLLLSSRGWDDIIYRDELQRLNGNGLTVVHTLTASQPPGWAGYARRVDAGMLAEVGPGPRTAAACLRLRPDALRRGCGRGAGAPGAPAAAHQNRAVRADGKLRWTN
jgi:ferredoxin-NADP reductase